MVILADVDVLDMKARNANRHGSLKQTTRTRKHDLAIQTTERAGE